MFSAVRITQHVDAADRFATTFEKIGSELHVLFLDNFPFDVVKVKMHMGHHLSPSWAFHKFAATCFSNERRLRVVIRLFGKYKHMGKIAASALNKFVKLLVKFYKQDNNLVRPVCQGTSTELRGLESDDRFSHGVSGEQPSSFRRYHRAMHELGGLRARDVVSRNGEPGACFLILCFLEAHYSSPRDKHVYCFANLLLPNSASDPTSFCDTEDRVCFRLDASVVKLCWYKDTAGNTKIFPASTM